MNRPFPDDEIAWKRKALLTLGVIGNIRRLAQMDQSTFMATQRQWTEHRWDDPAWSEAMSYFVAPGLTQAAFVSVCEKVAVLAFCPGGVSIFGLSFEADRDMSWIGWAMLDVMYLEAYLLMAPDIEASQATAQEPRRTTKKTAAKKR